MKIIDEKQMIKLMGIEAEKLSDYILGYFVLKLKINFSKNLSQYFSIFIFYLAIVPKKS